MMKIKEFFENLFKKEKKISKNNRLTIIATSVLVLTHIIVILAIILSFRYYAIYPSLFGSIVGMVICLLIIIDIIFFVGFNHKDLALKIISLTLVGFLFVGGTVGTYFIAKANGIVNSVLDNNSNANKTEIFSGVFVCYDQNLTFNSIKEFNENRIGLVSESSNGITYIAEEKLKEAGVEYTPIYFKTNSELVQALIDEQIDAMAITSAYRQIYSLEKDENSPFAKYLDHFIDFDPFEKELKVNTGKKAKNLSKDPFNVLLIGYSRTDIGSPIGLADSIILASINPQTYTVSMMSIARDSFVPIACYGGEYDKINSGRSTSRACFIDTVEDFINVGRSEKDRIDIDYYMELDYYGLVYMVNAIGGITVNNPVDFELDGTFVPAGENVFCDGIMALQFCRERHHMPNGDFDRQQHQKEVIIEIAKKFVTSGDITLPLNALEAASEWMSTDLTLDQLTTVFNLLLNTKNYTGLKTFNLVDFQTLRITGNGGLKYYSYSMHLPLWVYLIYQGSYDESITHMKEVLGHYDNINQNRNFEYSCIKPYVRPEFYQLSYPEKYMFTPDPMPAYWIDLSGMTLAEATAWASANGVSISVSRTITASDSEYDPTMEGLIFDQSVRYGTLISESSSCGVTIMGTGNVDLDDFFVPDFTGRDISKLISWANNHNITVTGNGSITSGRIVETQDHIGEAVEKVKTIKVTLKEAQKFTVSFDAKGGSVSPNSKQVEQGSTYGSLPTPTYTGKKFVGWFTGDGKQITSDSDVSITSNITLYAKWSDISKHAYQYLDTNGTIIESGEFDEGETIPSCSKTPTKAEDDEYTYSFSNWHKDTDEDGNVVFTPEFSKTSKSEGSGSGEGGSGEGGSGEGGSGEGGSGEGGSGEGGSGEGGSGSGEGGSGEGGSTE